MKTLSEWIQWKNNGICRGAFIGASGAWSYKLAIDGGNPTEDDLKLFLANLKNRTGWMQTTLDLGRETFEGFVKHWKKRVRPKEWIAFARVPFLGSIKQPEPEAGLKPGRPDIGCIEIWFKPSKEDEKEPLIIDKKLEIERK